MTNKNDTTIIDYDFFVDNALRSVVKNVLQMLYDEKNLGEHHFFITFETNHPSVRLSSDFHKKHPLNMTIVLQHQFSNLEVKDDYFSVTLSFNGKQENITVGYQAITQFTDPSTDFALQFTSFNEEENLILNTKEKKTEKTKPEEKTKVNEQKNNDKTPGEIISLDNFRKNR